MIEVIPVRDTYRFPKFALILNYQVYIKEFKYPAAKRNNCRCLSYLRHKEAFTNSSKEILIEVNKRNQLYSIIMIFDIV